MISEGDFSFPAISGIYPEIPLKISVFREKGGKFL